MSVRLRYLHNDMILLQYDMNHHFYHFLKLVSLTICRLYGFEETT